MPAELVIPVTEKDTASPQRGSLIELYRPRMRGILLAMGYLSILAIIAYGWKHRIEQPLTAENGAGYALGIVGGTLMLLLLLYPLRKHAGFMRRMGPVRFWFRTHMLFGIIGPVCILFHSGFQLGSLNSNIALFCMLLVAGSGLVGRYFYTRIHHGLYGRKATLEELTRHAELLSGSLESHLTDYPRIRNQVREFEALAHTKPAGIISSFLTLGSLGFRTWLLYLSLWRQVPSTLPTAQRKTLLRHIGAQLESVRKVTEFHFYERLFSIWHVLHFPFFLMLVLSGVVHVVAVHMY
ncbi:hypothetical protein DFR30_1306 [Thiogranum longum]|uniref:Ferric reductase like protein n=1 Tax=Thiogranum longum TaxID=1537524 RepID=A0A4R1H882_9GAMM|nr:transcriptional regulator [Thiogranum longum]TCK18047.1 hypothetical protein DFR30_1306 [Thiogranum longum]